MFESGEMQTAVRLRRREAVTVKGLWGALKKEPIALLGVAIAVVTLYLTYWRGPNFEIGVGQQALLLGYKTLGITCVFSNVGGRAGTITRLKAVTDNGEPLEAVWVSGGSDAFKLENGVHVPVSAATYEPLLPVLVKAGEQDSRTLWFLRRAAWLTPTGLGPKTITIEAYRGTEEAPTATTTFAVMIDSEALECVRKSQVDWDRGRGPWLECPIAIAKHPPARPNLSDSAGASTAGKAPPGSSASPATTLR